MHPTRRLRPWTTSSLLVAARLLAATLAVAMVALAAERARAQQSEEPDVHFSRIGTGPTGGTYFPMGGLIANAISNPPGSRPCDRGGSCGVPGLIAAAVSTNGSVANVEALEARTVDLALVQADVGFWAWKGEGIFSGREPFAGLRALAYLYPESIHLVARADSDIRTLADLRGKRVSIGEEKSGTLVEARLILNAFGLKTTDIEPSYLRLGPSADKLAPGDLDAFFFVGGAPVQAVTDLAQATPVRLIPLSGAMAEKLTGIFPYMTRNTIPANTYPGQSAAVPTLAVGAVLLTTDAMPEDRAYRIARSLWHPVSLDLYRRGHPGGGLLDPRHAMENTGVPLHDGAARYYDEMKALAAEGTGTQPAP
ncbi:TAXI family TRAP transporter solute-binding subunit [Caenispirillum bisanense]|uniref:TAXI family TRAP transporter solute-binding subunit n=1 Tax=Caenispirillum bisanense TaxID=414052 RepID=UPI0031E0E01D